MAIKEMAPTAHDAFQSIRRQRVATRDYAARRRTEFSSVCSADLVLSVAQHVRDVLAAMDVQAATPGLRDYARLMYGDRAHDMVAEYQAHRATLASLRDGIVTLFPKDANGWLLYQQLAADGSLTTRTFTVGQLAQARTLLDAVLATVPEV